MTAEVTAQDIASVIHAHPTRAEALMEAALGTYGAMIHG
jgi:pyruvate/2-oxoglutarate dehydrogenase complex dihydrolipoamide dehydrogenase (E3) component